MAWAIERKLPTREKFVLLMLSNYASNERGDCYPSLNRLCDDTGMSRNTVIEAIKAMESVGLMTIQRRTQDGVNLPNVYRLNFAWSSRMGSAADALRGGGSPDEPLARQPDGGGSPDEPKPVIQPITKKKENAGAKSAVLFDKETGQFTGTDAHLQRWTQAYPGVNVENELLRAGCWMLANPANAKQNNLRFLTNWMSRADKRPAPALVNSASRPQTRLERNAERARELIGTASSSYQTGERNVFDVEARQVGF